MGRQTDIGRTPPGHLPIACIKCETRYSTATIAEVLAGHTWICPQCAKPRKRRNPPKPEEQTG